MPTILIAGTSSDAGKSLIVAGLCRAFAQRGISVAPFKAQNMSNNSVVCPDGEIGRAQALQAYAAGLKPQVAFNPILLKPQSNRRSQLLINGVPSSTVGAKDYIEHRQHLRTVVAHSLHSLEENYEWVIIEGAGSPAEINLRHSDIANFGIENVPVYIVGDIDRGGVLAHLYGTYHIVDQEDQRRIKGFIINKFRGDSSLLEPGLIELEHKTGVPTLGIVPYIPDLWIDAEDSLSTQVGHVIGPGVYDSRRKPFRIAAIRLPRISNTTDIEAFAIHPGVVARWVDDPGSIAEADLVIIPGSKSTVADLEWLRAKGLDRVIIDRAQEQKPILGICGGFQMMCTRIIDPIESESTEAIAGLGIFGCDIIFEKDKILRTYPDGSYEIHHGRVHGHGPAQGNPADMGPVWGTHIHGLFDDNQRRLQYLISLGYEPLDTDELSFAQCRDEQLNSIAYVLEESGLVDRLISAHETEQQ